jgi:predicted PurR-regulated permease PerM
MYTNYTIYIPIYLPVFLVLAIFGMAYNYLVQRLERQGHDRGYMGLIVAFGCAVTLAGAGLIVGIDRIAWVFLCFVASGTPMIIGSIARHCRARAKQRRECLDHNDTIIRKEQ